MTSWRTGWKKILEIDDMTFEELMKTLTPEQRAIIDEEIQKKYELGFDDGYDSGYDAGFDAAT